VRCAAVLARRIKGCGGVHRGVEFGYRSNEPGDVDAVELARECLDGIGRSTADLADAVFIAQQMRDSSIEDLPGDLTRLPQYFLTVAGIGEVAKVGTFIDEPFAIAVDHDAERIRVLLESVADVEIAELGCVGVPSDCMTPGPVTTRCGTDVDRHLEPVAGVESRPTHFGEVPAGAEIARTPSRIGFESAARQHHRVGGQQRIPAITAYMYAADATVAFGEPYCPRAITQCHTGVDRDRSQRVDESGTAAPALDRQAAPEADSTGDLERLAPVQRQEPNTAFAHPQ
jgi:hypothetical protein